MKTIYLSAVMMAVISAFALTAYAADYCCPDKDTGNPCLSCRAPAYDNRPLPAAVPCPSGPGYTVQCVPPKTTCGTFCASGQIPAGWPYGWRSDYWLRPDSNF